MRVGEALIREQAQRSLLAIRPVTRTRGRTVLTSDAEHALRLGLASPYECPNRDAGVGISGNNLALAELGWLAV